jgi:hypothetical protein
MLSVFIFWVDSIIGNDSDTPETPVALTTATVDPNAAAPTETLAASEPTEAPTQPSAAPTEEGEAPSEAPADEPTEEPTEEPAGDATEEPADEATEEPGTEAAFAEGDEVTTNASVNMRSEASSTGGDETIIETLDAATPLTITGAPENDGEFDWYPVDTGTETGWVREDFLEAAAG